MQSSCSCYGVYSKPVKNVLILLIRKLQGEKEDRIISDLRGDFENNARAPVLFSVVLDLTGHY